MLISGRKQRQRRNVKRPVLRASESESRTEDRRSKTTTEILLSQRDRATLRSIEMIDQ